ncbi:MAG: hypothetical protein H5T86_13135, partial [Armatimonadetes bacterium]|nr:hypothetical protein [Armatimonadota bacterium]
SQLEPIRLVRCPQCGNYQETGTRCCPRVGCFALLGTAVTDAYRIDCGRVGPMPTFAEVPWNDPRIHAIQQHQGTNPTQPPPILQWLCQRFEQACRNAGPEMVVWLIAIFENPDAFIAHLRASGAQHWYTDVDESWLLDACTELERTPWSELLPSWRQAAPLIRGMGCNFPQNLSDGALRTAKSRLVQALRRRLGEMLTI